MLGQKIARSLLAAIMAISLSPFGNALAYADEVMPSASESSAAAPATSGNGSSEFAAANVEQPQEANVGEREVGDDVSGAEGQWAISQAVDVSLADGGTAEAMPETEAVGEQDDETVAENGTNGDKSVNDKVDNGAAEGAAANATSHRRGPC